MENLLYTLVLVVSFVDGGQTATNMVTIDNYPSKARCESHLAYLKKQYGTIGHIEFAQCVADEVGA